MERFDLLSSVHFEIGPIRPPSEGGINSLLIRACINCPWNRCRFCNVYKGRKFIYRSPEEVMEDIDKVKLIEEGIREISWRAGFGGRVDGSLGAYIVKRMGKLVGNPCFVLVFNWLYSGGRTVFLQDADPMILRTKDLVKIVSYLREKFPSIERITSYARIKSIKKKSPEELKEIREAGLTRLHAGIESGDKRVLERVEKGITPEEEIEAGRKAIEAGFELSLYIMPDLAGEEGSGSHAVETARVLSEINPHYIRVRPFIPVIGSPMYEEYIRGEIKLSSPKKRLLEIKLLVENLNVTSRICFDHRANPYLIGGIPLLRPDYEGYKLPEEREILLEDIDRALRMPEERFVKPEDLVGASL